jgi:transcriptional regulator with XRE-family HTH domain
MNLSIGERLKIIRASISQQDFAEEYELGLSKYQRFERNISQPSIDFLQKVLEKNKTVNPLWLFQGKGSMNIGSDDSAQENDARIDLAILKDVIKRVEDTIKKDGLEGTFSTTKKSELYALLYKHFFYKKMAYPKDEITIDEETVREFMSIAVS